MFHFSNIVRTKGDPKIVAGGPSLKRPEDQLARALGWFSIGLGIVELFAPRRVTETLGMEGRETLVRAFGAREILTGIMSLSVDKNAGLWARVGGDGLDAAALLSGLTADNPRKERRTGAADGRRHRRARLPRRAGHQAAAAAARCKAQALSDPQRFPQGH